jgi:hypothetical protein
MLLVDYPNYSGGVAIDPSQMISWRALVLNLLPHVAGDVGLALTGLLSILSLATLPLIWRGAWDPRGPRFAGQMLATIIVTLLVAYHSQLHGAVLLMVPGVIMLAQGTMPDVVRRTLPWIFFGPPFFEGLSLLLFGNRNLVPLLYLVAMAVALAAIVAQYSSRVPSQARPSPVDARVSD